MYLTKLVVNNKNGDNMLLYEKYFQKENGDISFPKEDYHLIDKNRMIIADGITRDPIGIKNFNDCKEKLSLFYPKPSGASLAAHTIIQTFKREKNMDLFSILKRANREVFTLNETYNGIYDYLECDYYGAVVSSVQIEENYIDCAWIGDCGILLLDEKGCIKFQTTNDVKRSVEHFDTKGLPWSNPEARKIARKRYRNNLKEKYSYGAITGEESALSYIKEKRLEKVKNDILILYSDGFLPFLTKEFFQIVLFNSDGIENYINSKIKENIKIYGEEKTIIIYSIT